MKPSFHLILKAALKVAGLVAALTLYGGLNIWAASGHVADGNTKEHSGVAAAQLSLNIDH